MGDISIIEFIVYGFICYSGLLMLIISVIKPIQFDNKGAIIGSIFLIPSLICAFVLASSGVNIIITNTVQSDLIKDLNSSRIWSDTSNQAVINPLQNPIWITVHMLIFFTIFIHIITNILRLFGLIGKKSRTTFEDA